MADGGESLTGVGAATADEDIGMERGAQSGRGFSCWPACVCPLCGPPCNGIPNHDGHGSI